MFKLLPGHTNTSIQLVLSLGKQSVSVIRGAERGRNGALRPTSPDPIVRPPRRCDIKKVNLNHYGSEMCGHW